MKSWLSTRDEQIVNLTREIDYSRYLQVTRDKDAFNIETHKYNLTSKQAEAEGRITSSLFASAAKAGVSDTTIMNLANIFQWDIDFMLDIRHGDEFHIIVEELWRDGKRVAEGDILAAEFVNQGEVFRGIRYRDPDGNTSYFAPDGRSLRQAFLRAPLEFSRISSNFNPNRRHPILNTLRAHQGVDYAAPNGTPVKTAGDGKIIFRGVKGGYGNTIIVQHGNNVSTLYGHLSRFNKQYQNGSRVRQGDSYRVRRPVRTCNRTAPALRIPQKRGAHESAHRKTAECRSHQPITESRFSPHSSSFTCTTG